MSALTQKELFDEIDTLPIDIKTQIVDKILNSILPNDKSIDELWLKEVQKRKNELDSGEVTLVDGDEVFAKISQRLKP